jgi:tricorn protease
MAVIIRRHVATLVLTVLVALGPSVLAAEPPTLFRRPAVNATHVVFAYAGDLWRVPREGGDAERLTSGVGIESDPSFSPDGSRIAFTGQYDGNIDVFVVAASGGVPTRLTYHPLADEVVGWTPDGRRVLFASERHSESSFPRLFTVSVDGGFPEELPLPMGERGSYSPDGSFLAYEPLAQWQPAWKRYRGGQTDKIWIARLSDSSVEEIPRPNSNDRFPMWVGDTVYFISDRDEGRATLFAYDRATRAVREVITPDGLDILSASAWRGDRSSGAQIAFERFGSIHLLDLASGHVRAVPIRVSADIATLRPRFEKVGERLTAAAISPTGARAVFEARGEILTVPAEKGDARNLTNTPGVMERDPAWSPDGRSIAYFSDESGEYALHIRDQKGSGDVRKISLPPLFYYSPVWSPDSQKIAFTDKALNLWYVSLDKGVPVKVDRNPFGLRDDVLGPVWSPDSRWIAYVKQLDNRLRAVFVYSLDTASTHQVTDGLGDARYPAFDKGGKYLYFTASTNLGPAFSFAEMSTFPYLSSRSVYAAVLRKDQPSPLAPESDDEKGEEETKEKEGKEGTGSGEKSVGDAAKNAAAKKSTPEPVAIDFERIDQRVIALPIPSLDFVDLRVGKANKLYLIEEPVTGPETTGPARYSVHAFDLEKRKVDKVLEGISAFDVSANGEKVLYRQEQKWLIKAADGLGAAAGSSGGPGGGDGGSSGVLGTDTLQVRVDPKVEWRQMFNEVWRSERDFFYDPNLHGLDVAKARATYAPYVDAVAHRADLTHLFTEMLNQLTIGHMFIAGGDAPRPDTVPGGLLGCDFRIDNGRYRFARIYSGENWNPSLRAPLTQPGVEVRVGDYLLAVNGRELRAADNVHAFFENTADRQVVIRVGPNADGSGARDVTVVPIRSEAGLRNRAWIEANRRRVDELSAGALAYIYVPDTSSEGYASFNRYFFAQTEKRGAVVDERFNGGGALADHIVEYLSRPLLNYIYFREGRDVPTPLGAIYGPKAMIINELAGSGGDALPWYFRKMQIGPLVGKRTWGGLVASFPAPRLMDGGFVTAPDAAIYGLDGQWEVENVGVGPDVDVDLDPKVWREGRDPQLERAVALLMEELRKNPSPMPKRPAFPTYR